MDVGCTERSDPPLDGEGSLEVALGDLGSPAGTVDEALADAYVKGYEEKWDRREESDVLHGAECEHCAPSAMQEILETATVRVVTLMIAFDREGVDSDMVSALEYISFADHLTLIGSSERDVTLGL
jgi:hypothetical protein